MNEFLSSSQRPGRTLNPRRRRAHRRPEFESCEPRTLLAVSISDVSLLEGNSGTTAFVFTLSLDAPDMYGFTLNVNTRDGTALAGEDYVALSFEPVNFGPGQLTATVTVDVIGELIREPDEFFYLDIDTSTSYPITDGEGLGTIQNDDFQADLFLTHLRLPPSIPLCDNFFATIDLTNLGPDPATNVVLTNLIPGNTAYVDATLSPMIPGSIIQFVSGQVIATIPTLDVSQSVVLSIQLQPTATGTATNSASVTADQSDPDPVDNTVSESTTIIDPGVLGFEFASYTVLEDAGFATITVERLGGAEGPVSVLYSTAPGTATPGDDYVPVTGTLNFADGQFFQSFNIPIIANPSIVPDRTVNLLLSQSTACPGGLESAVLTIRETDLLTVSIEDVAVTEGEGVVAQFPVILSEPSTLRVGFIVEFATSNGTAQAGIDYVAASGYVEFPPQSIVQYIPITILDDLQLEGPETFFVTLTQVLVYSNDPPGFFPTDRVIIARATATGTIRDDDSLVVTNTNDTGRGSLRRAIQVANANPGINRVTFRIPGSGVQVIQPLSPLPSIFDPVIIDAYSQPGSRQNSQAIGSDAVILVELSGNQLQSDASGLVISAGLSTITGLAIGGFPTSGITLIAQGNNTIQGNYLGTDATGTQARPNRFDGLDILNSSDNLIGGTTPAARNLFSGNGSTGIQILGNFPLENDGVIFQADSSRNLLLGNYIGTDATGTRALGNALAGVFVNNASANVIGAGSPQTRNVISGNAGVGIQLYLAGATANVVQGNFIGTDATGIARLGNALDGVFINQAPANLIGGSSPGQGNLISANGSVGLQVLGAGATGNVVQGNLIGTTASGLAPLGNLADGVFLNGSAGTLLGGPDPASANVIAANRFSGVHLAAGASANIVQRNLIGISLDQATPLGNAGYGVSLNDSAGNTIGTADGPNIIAFNRFGGIATFLGTRQLINQAQGGNAIGPNTLFSNGLHAAPPLPPLDPTLARPNGHARAVRSWNRSPQQPAARLRPRPATTTKQTTPAQASLRRQVSPQAGVVFKARFARFR